MIKNSAFGLILILLLLATPSSAIEICNEADNPDVITAGTNILTIDYLGIVDNGVTETGADPSYASLWLIIYDPRHYADIPEMNEDEWRRSHEIARFQIPGPSTQGRWRNDDEVAYRNFGIYDWASDRFDQVVFRIYVEEPGEGVATDTLMWGVIQEDDTYDSNLEFIGGSLQINFRTTTLPENVLRPEATITETWLVHNAESGSYNGLEIHVKLQIDNMRARQCRLAAYVHLDSNGESVYSNIDDPTFSTPSGYLTVQEEFVPIYPETIFNDFVLFIPYEAFPTSDDYVDYHANLEILDNDWNYLGSIQTPAFSVLRPKGL